MATPSDLSALTLPISLEMLGFAQQVAAPVSQETIADRVFGNAIAVATLHTFFKMMGIVSHYDKSALFNSTLQLTADVSDLQVSKAGQLECRAVSSDQLSFTVPTAVQQDRIGYVFVSFELDRRRATIHGFLPRIETGSISREQLRSIEFLLQYLDALAAPHLSLTRWLSGRFDPGWIPIEAISPAQPAFRAVINHPPALTASDSIHGGQIRLVKPLVWPAHGGLMPTEHHVLVVEASQIAPLTMRASVQVHPADLYKYLPFGLTLRILDKAGNGIMDTTARKTDSYLQLPFKGTPGEPFQVQVSLADYLIVEQFQL